MVSNVRNMKLTTVDDLFSTEESRQASKEARSTPPSSFQPVNENAKQVVELSLDDLFPFKGHPFKVRDDDEMTALVESVAEYGVRQPVQVRPRPEGGYEILAGHRRIEASRRAVKDKVPAIIENVDDDLATIIMVDTNLGQRQNLLPSERAFAYKAKLEAMKRQGERTDLTSCQLGAKSLKGRADEEISKGTTDSARTIQRFIRLTELIPQLLEAVDADKLAFIPAVTLSYLKPAEQKDLWEYMEREQVLPSLKQAELLKEASEKGDWSLTLLDVYMTSTRQESSKATIRLEKLDLYWQRQTPKQAEKELMCIAAAVPKMRQYTTIFPDNLTPEQFTQKLMDLVVRTHNQRLEHQRK
ncbi:MAG TPA: ParB/RepB/Spo0J family partition protein [Clostridia bacterium]|nr:ParB/RepB/Spo0J family partition protein [Clostridia bacterium]